MPVVDSTKKSLKGEQVNKVSGHCSGGRLSKQQLAETLDKARASVSDCCKVDCTREQRR